MKPVDIENEILITLRRCGGKDGSDGATISSLHRTLSPAPGGVPSWREVANAVCRMERMGFLAIVGDEQVGEACQPIYALTRWGIQAAHTARIQKHNAQVAGTPKTEHDSVQEGAK